EAWRVESRRAGDAPRHAQGFAGEDAGGEPALRRSVGELADAVAADVRLARSDLRAAGDGGRLLALRNGVRRLRNSRGRRGDEHAQLSPDAGRVHARLGIAQPRLR